MYITLDTYKILCAISSKQQLISNSRLITTMERLIITSQCRPPPPAECYEEIVYFDYDDDTDDDGEFDPEDDWSVDFLQKLSLQKRSTSQPLPIGTNKVKRPRDHRNINFHNAFNMDVEKIQSVHYAETHSSHLYPPNPEFRAVYDLWLEHQSCYWSSFENDPTQDRAKFQAAPLQLQTVVCKMISCLIYGDTIVADTIWHNMDESITNIETRAMLCDQAAREFVHRDVYAKMLDVSPNADEYRKMPFIKKLLQPFNDCIKHYTEYNTIHFQFYFIMLCEVIFFAPMFQTICYIATKGYAPRLCDSNVLVMRDEYLHYRHARLQLSMMTNKLDKRVARTILREFVQSVMVLCRSIVGDYRSSEEDDGDRMNVYNIDVVIDHLKFVTRQFLVDNTMDDERLDATDDFYRDILLHTTTPAHNYMHMPQCSIKYNLMESSSTSYMLPGNTTKINMNF